MSLLLCASAVSAQTPERPITVGLSPIGTSAPQAPLQLSDAIRAAVEGNLEVAAARQHVAPLRTRPAQVLSLPPPMLEAQIWQWPIATVNPANADMYMLTASQDLPGRGKRDILARLAAAEVRVSELVVTTREREIAAAVTAAYWDLSIGRRAIAIHHASVELVQGWADLAQAKYAEGRESQHGVLKVTLALTRLHDDLIDLESETQQATIRLNALMNRPVGTPIGPVTEPDELIVVATLGDLQELALREHSDLRVADAAISRAQAQQDVARSTGTPDWTVGGGYMVRPRQGDAWMASVSLTWPRAPWSRGALDARTAEAVAATRANEAEQHALEARVRAGVADAYVRVKAAEARAALLRTALLPQSRQIIEVSRISYQTDRLDVLTVLENEGALLEARLAYDRVLADWRRALSDLERAAGTTLPPATIQPVVRTEVQQ